MQHYKRVYPDGRNRNRWLSAGLALAAGVVIISGVLSRGGESFLLQQLPAETPVPMEEAFDETPAEKVIELENAVWYALQVGVFEGEEAAGQSSVAFQKRGAAGYLWQDGRYRVLAAAYPVQEDARRVRDQLKQDHNIDSYLYEISLPAVSLRLKGMQGQIDILQAAFVHARELPLQLQSLSDSLDRQGMSTLQAVERLAALKNQMDLVTLRLQQRFTAPIHAAVQNLVDCFQHFGQFVSTISADDSAVVIGMKLKYQTFETLWDLQSVYQSLNRT